MVTRILSSISSVAVLAAAALALLSTSAFAQADGGRTVYWNTYLGGGVAGGSTGNATDELEGVTTDRDGGVFVTGKTNAASFPQTLDGVRATGDSDIVITRLSTDGGVLWSRVIGGAGDDVGKRLIFTDSIENHLLVAGSTGSSTLRDGGFPVMGNFVGTKTPFLARIELDGRIAWFMYLGGSGNDEVYDLSVVPSAQWAYVTGEASGDVFITKLNIADPSPSILWSKRFGTADSLDVGYAVASHHQFTTLLYVGGRTGVVKPTDTSVVPPDNVYGGEVSDGFLARIEPNTGTMLWFKYLGGNGQDEVRAILVQEATGGHTILGNTVSTNYPPQVGRPGRNIFLARLTDTSGTLAQERLVGAGGETMQGHASTDLFGNIYFGGSTFSPNTLARNAFDPTFQGGGGFNDDGFIAMLDRDLQRIAWASYVGGTSTTSEAVRDVSAVPHGQLTFVGSTSAGSGVLVTNSGEDLTANGGSDGYIFRMPVDVKPPIAGTVTGRFNADNNVVATWSGFYDDETDIDYQLDLLESGFVVETATAPYNATTHTFAFTPNPPRVYRVRVTAKDLFDHTIAATSDPVVTEPPDAGTPDGGGGGSDGGGEPEGPPGNGVKDSPLGWGCGSVGGGTLLGVLVLMAMALLLGRRASGS